MATDWTNSDGLRVYFGTNEGKVSPGGEYGTMTDGGVHVLEFDLDCTDYAASSNNILDYTIKVPTNAIILKASVTVLVVPDGGTSFDFGLMKMDGTELNYDGIIDGVTEAGLDDTEGATYVFEPDVSPDTGAVGAMVGDLNGVTEEGYPSITVAGTFTAGRLLYRIYYSMRPQTIA
jgi:hypothetical protein